MDLLNVEEAKQRLGVSESTLRRLLYNHRIEAETIDRRLYFRAEDIDQLALRRRKVDVPSQSLSNDPLERLSNAEQEIAKLRQEVDALKASMHEASQRDEKPIAPRAPAERPYRPRKKEDRTPQCPQRQRAHFLKGS